MATAKKAGDKRGTPWLKLLAVVVLIGGGIAWYYGDIIDGYAKAGTGYAAKTACSCRFIGGREMGQCKDDLMPGMAAIWLSEDDAARSVTASVPLVESTTATYRDGYGCVLERWDG
ncbi:hypothetical protein GCM10023208_01610 [Erythrobacter westpacificensis]|uniref:Uncharacterized protein n=1 Tax=Erythrobacter westpacificensis TaxID=1055231 RepID=A0ABP9JZF6_9SPHN